jgi:hypothetical protein
MKRKALKGMSAKRRSQLGDRSDVRKVVLDRDENRCQCGLEECTNHATDVHELKSRARGGSILDSTNCISLCRSCHSFITTHPAWALANGFALASWATEAEYRAAERARMRFYWGEQHYVLEDEDGEEPELI